MFDDVIIHAIAQQRQGPRLQGSIAAEERLRWLEERLIADGSVMITEAAVELDVSEMTIRRDLLQLEERGSARRVRGGATAVGPQPFATRDHRGAKAKSAIAAKVVPLIPARGTVALDASSTVVRLAGLLDHAVDLTILTNGPETFAALQDRPGVQPILTGGRLDPRTGSLVGPVASRSAEQFAVDLFVTSAAALSSTGTLEAAIEEAEVKRSIAAGARQIVVAADATKLRQAGVATALAWDQVDVLVTELEPSDERLASYRDLVTIR